MIQFLRSIDRDEVLYSALLCFSLAFTALQAFIAVRDIWGHVSHLLTQIAQILS
jgi:hypothetical protein